MEQIELTVRNVMKFLKDKEFPTAKTRKFGVDLGIPLGKVDQFKKENPDLEDMLMSVINYWLCNDSAKSWDKLAEALRFCDCNNMADEIQERRPPIERKKADTTCLPHHCTQMDEGLKKQFSHLLEKTREHLNHSRQDILGALMQLPQQQKDICSSIFIEEFDRLQGCKWDLVFLQGKLWNFINYDVLQHIINVYVPTLKTDMETYVTQFKEAVKAKKISIFSLIENLGPYTSAIPEGFREYWIRLRKDQVKCTCEEIENLHTKAKELINKNATSLSITRAAEMILLADIGYGSVIVVWLVLEEVVSTLHTSLTHLIREDAEFIERHDISDMVLDNFILYPDGPAEQFWNACRRGDLRQVKEMMESDNVDISKKDEVSRWNFLHCTARHGHISVLDLLLESPDISMLSEIDSQDKRGCTAVLLAARAGHEGVVCSLLERGANPNVQDNILKMNPLLTAAETGNLPVLKMCLTRPNIDLTVTNREGKTALILAAKRGDVMMVDLLMESGKDLDPEAQDEMNCTALHAAVESGNPEVVKKLIAIAPAARDIEDKDGADVLSLSKPHTEVHSWLKDRLEEELIKAAKDNDLVRVKTSLQIKDVDLVAREKDKYGWTALLWACENGHNEVVDILLEHGADVDAEDSSKWTGLLLASRNGYLTIVRKLLDKGADVNKLTDDSWSSLIWAAQEGHTEVARLLIKRGANITQEDELGFSALLLASQEGHLDIVKLLVEDEETELDIDQKTKSGWTAAMLATKNEHEDILRYLVEHESDIHYHNVEEAHGINALHIASYLGFNKIVRYLCLQLKMKVNVQDEDGITPLMFAAKQGRYEVFRTLVENGRADVNIVENHYKWTALFFAAEAGHQKVVEYLMSTKKIDLNHRDMKDKTIVDLADAINPKAMDYLLTHHKAATEAIWTANKRNPAYKPFDLKDYQPLLNKMEISAEPKALQVGA